MVLNKLEERHDGLYITRRREFSRIGRFKDISISKAIDFAYDMSFGKNGEHRNHRSGGVHKRKNGEIFANTFQGKLSEFAIYNSLYKKCGDIQEPDLDTYGLGEWDNCDFEVNSKKISVKSTKSFGNLMLLETKDWNKDGEYIPNISKGTSLYDIFILVRINPFCEDLLKRMKALYSNEVEKDKLIKEIRTKEWEYDIPGFITREDLMYAIRNNYIINQGDMLNGKTKMDAENYYVQAGDMYSIDELIKLLNE